MNFISNLSKLKRANHSARWKHYESNPIKEKEVEKCRQIFIIGKQNRKQSEGIWRDASRSWTCYWISTWKCNTHDQLFRRRGSIAMKLLQYLIVGSRSPENDPQLHRYVRMEIKLQNSKWTCRIRMDWHVDSIPFILVYLYRSLTHDVFSRNEINHNVKNAIEIRCSSEVCTSKYEILIL